MKRSVSSARHSLLLQHIHLFQPIQGTSCCRPLPTQVLEAKNPCGLSWKRERDLVQTNHSIIFLKRSIRYPTDDFVHCQDSIGLDAPSESDDRLILDCDGPNNQETFFSVESDKSSIRATVVDAILAYLVCSQPESPFVTVCYYWFGISTLRRDLHTWPCSR